jgi:hypothetical protein
VLKSVDDAVEVLGVAHHVYAVVRPVAHIDCNLAEFHAQHYVFFRCMC